MATNKNFGNNIVNNIADESLRKAIKVNSFSKSDGINQFDNIEIVKKVAKNSKWEITERLDHYLELFEKNFELQGGRVLWAEDDKDALNYIHQIIKEQNAKNIVKTKSSTLNEIGLKSYLTKNEIHVQETEIGELILEELNLESNHITNSLNDILESKVLHLWKKGVEKNTLSGINELFPLIKNKSILADISITGANFLLAKEGKVLLSENEGNIRFASSFSKTHIVVVGIDKILSSIHDLPLFLPLLASYNNGQKMTVHNSLIGGPRKRGENDGPERMIVILLDNKRSELLSKEFREALYCIKCGSCINVCPVYQNIGGLAYEAPYSGPIGSVISPHLKGVYDYGHLSFASTLCGACTMNCPINIQIDTLLAKNRKLYINYGYGTWSEKIKMQLFRSAMKHPFVIKIPNKWMKEWLYQRVFADRWEKGRSAIEFSETPFYKLYKKSNFNKK